MVAERCISGKAIMISLRVVQSHMVAELLSHLGQKRVSLRVVQSHMVAERLCVHLRPFLRLRVVQSHMVAELE